MTEGKLITCDLCRVQRFVASDEEKVCFCVIGSPDPNRNNHVCPACAQRIAAWYRDVPFNSTKAAPVEHDWRS